MSATLQQGWTRDEFLDWVERQEEPYEFDGTEPVAMNGGLYDHNLICSNILVALSNALRGTLWVVLGQGMGVATAGRAVRFPDALVALPPDTNKARLITPPAVVFAVVSPSSGRLDRIVKPREYAFVPSILCYAIVEPDADGVQLLTRGDGTAPWTATPLALGDTVDLRAAGVPASIPVAAIYEGIPFDG